MYQLVGIFMLGILTGWMAEWIFVRLFVPNPKKKLEAALQASRRENEQLQKQNDALQTAHNISQKTHATAPEKTLVQPSEALVVVEPTPTAITVSKQVQEEDDLTKLSGIGPKLEEAMKLAGINSYAQLAKLSVEDLNASLASSGIRYSKAAAESWATQAKLAKENDWDGLKTYQSALKG
ncbi:helix-hairpin-helix domain-containing protein [Thiothrix lacustris]|uniref:Helix-hairpin-helix domain-containing protein n=1 Tax=Thiothrix lacustris TaxID=525917 RepID=A0ABY9MS86_9GAMM|nr:helix-hairpin-helix domain-containing protein [Thiothrix lacustris]WML90691.1 helix-hairpin-helix domain-containing protein [Thiothrix lacustris]